MGCVIIDHFTYFYEEKLAHDGNICVAVSPKHKFASLYTYSSKDSGSGKALVVYRTDNPEYLARTDIQYWRR